MVYSVGEMAELLGIPASTLRYYDKEGLLPFVERTPGGARRFQEKDIEWLRVIGCMKQAGMSIREIRVYMELAAQGDASIGARLERWKWWNISAGITRQRRRPGRWRRCGR